MNDLFSSIKSKCSQCLLKTKQKSKSEHHFHVLNELDSPWLHKGQNSNVLVIVEQPQDSTEQHKKNLRILKNYILREQRINADFIVGIECEVDEYFTDERDRVLGRLDWLPNPYHSIYSCCNTIEDFYQYDVIITVGKGLYTVTKSDDINSWEEFVEFKFNPTYFYTEFNTKKIRVYPLPEMASLFLDNFETHVYLMHQMREILTYLRGNIDKENDPHECIIVDDPNEFLLQHMDEEIVACDIETSEMTNFNDMFNKGFEIICVTMSFDGKTGYFLPFNKIDKETLSEFFKRVKQIWANGKFDCKCLTLMGIKNCRVDEDVILLFHMLSTERSRNSIKTLAWLIGFGGYDKELEKIKKEYKINDYRRIPKDILVPYSCLDPIVTFRLYQLGTDLGKKQQQVIQCYRELIETFPSYLEMEINGIELNYDYLNKFDKDLQIKIKDIATEIAIELSLNESDISSAEKLGKALERKKLPAINRVKKGHFATGESELLAWSKKGYKIADKIIEFRKTSKLRDAFVGNTEKITREEIFDGYISDDTKSVGLTKFICDDLRLHPIYGVAMTDSGRDKCASNNAMQLPSQGEEGKLFKPVIGCPEDYYILNLDYSGFQLRIGAHYSKDKNMMDAFIKYGADIHSITASNLFVRDKSLEEFMQLKKIEPFKSLRFKSKSINFRFLFGGVAKTFVPQLKDEWTVGDMKDYAEKNNIPILEDEDETWLKVAEDIREKFFKAYPDLLTNYIERNRRLATRDGYVDSDGGWRRHLPYLMYFGKNTNNKKYYGMLNICVNSPTQSLEMYIFHKAKKKVYDEFKKRKLKSKFMMAIYDYYGIYVHKSEIEEVYYILKGNCEDKKTYAVPFEVEMSIGKVWEGSDSIELNDGNIKEVARKLG